MAKKQATLDLGIADEKKVKKFRERALLKAKLKHYIDIYGIRGGRKIFELETAAAGKEPEISIEEASEIALVLISKTTTIMRDIERSTIFNYFSYVMRVLEHMVKKDFTRDKDVVVIEGIGLAAGSMYSLFKHGAIIRKKLMNYPEKYPGAVKLSEEGRKHVYTALKSRAELYKKSSIKSLLSYQESRLEEAMDYRGSILFGGEFMKLIHKHIPKEAKPEDVNKANAIAGSLLTDIFYIALVPPKEDIEYMIKLREALNNLEYVDPRG